MMMRKLVSEIRALRVLMVVLASFVLSSCGGGDGSSTPPPTPDADPTGYYDLTGSATVISLLDGNPITISNMGALVYNNRILMFSADGHELYDITISSINGNSFTGTATDYYYLTNQQTTTSTVSGTIRQGTSITGTLTGQYLGSGTFSLTYNNQTGSVPASTSTNWGLPVGVSSTNYILNTDGVGNISTNTTVTDRSFANCTIDTTKAHTIAATGSKNLYNVTVTITGCTADTLFNGTYTGLAAVQDASGSTLDLAIVKSDGSRSVSGSFAVQP